MADAYTAAQQDLYNQRAAILAAMAAQGTQGKQYYDATQADLAAERHNAIASALQEAQNRGAPANMLASIQSQVEAPFNRASTNVNNGAIAQQTWRNNLGDATANYMDQQVAAIPGLRIIAQTKAAADQAKANLQAAKDAASLARANRTAAGKSSSGSTGGPKFSSSLATATTKAATQAHQQSVAADTGHVGQPFGPLAHSAFDAITGKAGTGPGAFAKAVQLLNNSADSGHFWRDQPRAGMLDYNAMLKWLQSYYGTPSPDELEAARQSLLNQGSY